MSPCAHNLGLLKKQRTPRHGPISKSYTLNSDMSQPSLWPRYETSENEVSCDCLQACSVHLPHNCSLLAVGQLDNNMSSQHLPHLPYSHAHHQSSASKPWVPLACITAIACFLRCCEWRWGIPWGFLLRRLGWRVTAQSKAGSLVKGVPWEAE